MVDKSKLAIATSQIQNRFLLTHIINYPCNFSSHFYPFPRLALIHDK
ncbi:MAG: hypothetical protein MGU50_03190 [Trichodesmium sp. MAG_R02]|nr:hypothetical protein [Trichodesmium sp. MAG_R02]